MTDMLKARDETAGRFASGSARTPAVTPAEQSCFLFGCVRRVLVCGERSEPHLYQDKHTPNRQEELIEVAR